MRGYSSKDFSDLEIINNENFFGEKNNLTLNNISIGKELAFTLGLKIGDEITIMSPSGIRNYYIGNLPKQKSFRVKSFFESGLADFDNNIAFINLDTFEEFLEKKSSDRAQIFRDPQNIENQKKIVQQVIFPDELYLLVGLI